MGRELKRVPLDFNAPLKEVWQGYINPHQYCQCPACGGGGYSPEARQLQDRWYGWAPFQPEDNGSKPYLPNHPAIITQAIRNYPNKSKAMVKAEGVRLAEHYNKAWNHHLNDDEVAVLVAAGRLIDLTHKWNGKQWVKIEPPYMPTAQEVNDWSLSGFGHDSINCCLVIEHYCKKNNIPRLCPECNGKCAYWETPEHEEAYENWECEEPPTGEGYQLWETTTEGSPISPVFKTLKELCAWAEDGATVFGENKATKEEWLEMLDDGLVCHKEGSMVFI